MSEPKGTYATHVLEAEEFTCELYGHCPACGRWVTKESLIVDWEMELFDDPEPAVTWAVVGCQECYET
jgi:hypothetical protein